MIRLCIIKCVTVLILICPIGNFAYGDVVSLPDPLKLVAQSKYYGQITNDQAAQIIEICAGKTYKTRSIVDKDNFFMDVPKETIAHPLVLRRKKSFKWIEVKHVQLLKKSIKLTYVTSFLGMNNYGDLELDPYECELSDLALAAITLSGFPLTLEKAIPAAYVAPALKTGIDLDEGLNKLKGTYNQGLISEAVWESKQKELIESKLKEFYDKGLISKTIYESRQKELSESTITK